MEDVLVLGGLVLIGAALWSLSPLIAAFFIGTVLLLAGLSAKGKQSRGSR